MMPIEQFLIRRPKDVTHAEFCVDLERAAAQFDLASCLDGEFTQASIRLWVGFGFKLGFSLKLGLGFRSGSGFGLRLGLRAR